MWWPVVRNAKLNRKLNYFLDNKPSNVAVVCLPNIIWRIPGTQGSISKYLIQMRWLKEGGGGGGGTYVCFQE